MALSRRVACPIVTRQRKVTNAQVADLSRLSMSTTSSSLIEPEDVVDVTISSGLEEAGRITPTPVRVGDKRHCNNCPHRSGTTCRP